jgi:hypothetical protein
MDGVVFFLVGVNKLCFICERGLLALLLCYIISIGGILMKLRISFIIFHLVMIGYKFDIKFFFFFLKLFDSGIDFNDLII